MPSELLPSQSHSQSQSHRTHVHPRSTTSTGTAHITTTATSPLTSPNFHANGHPNGKHKTKYLVHGAAGRLHSRVPSNKGIHKPNVDSSQNEFATKKSVRSSSTTSLKKNNSHVSLKRNRSSGEVKAKTSVTFEIGDQDEGWEEASSSASPALSRSVSRSASSTHPSANNSQPHSPPESPSRTTRTTSTTSQLMRPSSADPKAITERLLSRSSSHLNTTKMSLATATPTGPFSGLTSSPEKAIALMPKNASSNTTAEVISRFVSGSGTPSEPSQSPSQPSAPENQPSNSLSDDFKRAQSMHNLNQNPISPTSFCASALAPRATQAAAHSRTQQKLWLQRASSIIDPTQILTASGPRSSLVGAAYEGRDPRIKNQLERTRLEHLVVRRYQDPVGDAIRRLKVLKGGTHSGTHGGRRKSIPDRQHHGTSRSVDVTGSAGARLGMRGVIGNGNGPGLISAPSSRVHSLRGSLDRNVPGDGLDSAGALKTTHGSVADYDGVAAVLRRLWDKNYDFGHSAE